MWAPFAPLCQSCEWILCVRGVSFLFFFSWAHQMHHWSPVPIHQRAPLLKERKGRFKAFHALFRHRSLTLLLPGGMLKITGKAPQVGCWEAAGWGGAGCWEARWAPSKSLFFFLLPPPLTSIVKEAEPLTSPSSCSAASQPSWVEGRRKQGIKRGNEAPNWTHCVSPRPDPRRAHRGRTRRHGGLRGGRLQREIVMERQTRGRLFGGPPRFTFTFLFCFLFILCCSLLLKKKKSQQEGCFYYLIVYQTE